MKSLFLWCLYHPVRALLIRLPLCLSLFFADRLGDMEYLLVGRRNRKLTHYMQRILAATPWAARVEELKHRNFRFRYRNLIARQLQTAGRLRPPSPTGFSLESLAGRGVCFPMCHIGYFFVGFTSLAEAFPQPIYTTSMMREGETALEAQCIAQKMEMIRNLKTHPIFDLASLKKTCLPAVARGEGGYIPTLDVVTNRAKAYPLLGGEVILSLDATAAYVDENRLPVVPFFVTGNDLRSPKVELPGCFDPQEETEPDAFSRWYLEILERCVEQHPEVVDWFFWWKNTERYAQRKRS
ncbi:MAG: hypothetical protein C0621_02320 [Desulfuromonas sp.]|nr:MAG: hypothetical protein C0621_02320 [Desulfuromonas sp.]